MYYGTVHWPTVVCGEGVCECWYDHLSVVLLCVLYSHRIRSCARLVVMVDWRMLSQQSKEELTQIGRIQER